ncbi:MAG: ABC transporter substrate-binding protein [Chloroflexota bacterium]
MVVLAACGATGPVGSTSSQASPAPQSTTSVSNAAGPASASKILTPVRVGTLGQASDAGLYLAEDRGFFRQEGISPRFTGFKTAAEEIAPLGAGQLDVGGGAVSAGLFNSVARNISVKAVADKGSFLPSHGFSALVVRDDLLASGAIKSPRDLVGKTIAITAKAASPDFVIAHLLEQNGIRESQVHLVPMSPSDVVPAFKNHAIDAAITTEPQPTILDDLHLAKPWMRGDKLAPNLQNAVLLYSGAWASAHRDVAERFMIAYLRGVRVYDDAFNKGIGKASVLATLVKYTHQRDPAIFGRMVTPGLDPNGRLNVASMQQMLDWFRKRGYVKSQTVTLAQAVDQTFAQHAVAKLGTYR